MHMLQFANNARVGGAPPCYPDNVAFPELFMKTLKQFKGQGAGIPIQCVLFALCALILSVLTIVFRLQIRQGRGFDHAILCH